MCEFAEVREAVHGALGDLYGRDFELVERKVNERSITHWLAVYIQERFGDWNVDCEYNKNGLDPKRLPINPSKTSTADTDGNTVYPDIIVHRRGTTDNLLVIEVKKAWTRAGLDTDIRKLRSFGELEEFAYRFGASVVLSRHKVSIQWFTAGDEAHAETFTPVVADGGA
jgi:hypothetical protein